MVVHFMAPIKTPLAGITGGVGAMEFLGQSPPWLISVGVQLAIVLIVLRAVVFFEFRVHEAKEERLLLALDTTGSAFSDMRESVEAAVRAIKQEVRGMRDDIDTLKVKVDAQGRRILAIEESPLKKFLPQTFPLDLGKP